MFMALGLNCPVYDSIDTVAERNNYQRHFLKTLHSKHEKKIATKCVSSPLFLEGNTV